jgi:hypothetical protein
MFVLARLRQWLLPWFTLAAAPPPEPEAPGLRDWADLPPHHPVCGGAP